MKGNKKHPIWLLIMPLCVLIMGVSCMQNTQKIQDKVRTFSELKWTTIDGYDVSISEYKGKIVVVDFWAMWCKPCLNVFPVMSKLIAEYPDSFVLLTVNVSDDIYRIRNFKKKTEYPFVWAIDKKKVFRQLGRNAIPFRMVFDTNGNLIDTKTGASPPSKEYDETKYLIEKHINNQQTESL